MNEPIIDLIFGKCSRENILQAIESDMYINFHNCELMDRRTMLHLYLNLSLNGIYYNYCPEFHIFGPDIEVEKFKHKVAKGKIYIPGYEARQPLTTIRTKDKLVADIESLLESLVNSDEFLVKKYGQLLGIVESFDETIDKKNLIICICTYLHSKFLENRFGANKRNCTAFVEDLYNKYHKEKVFSSGIYYYFGDHGERLITSQPEEVMKVLGKKKKKREDFKPSDFGKKVMKIPAPDEKKTIGVKPLKMSSVTSGLTSKTLKERKKIVGKIEKYIFAL